MSERPTFFEPIRQRAAATWDELERNRDIAGPWHQLFNQVQSPRHVVSELLQNADDAGASEASVRIENGTFVFEHDGQDFSEEHFTSLCRFGYSNKRSLHTIGFRGIGFKSTFSLGDSVYVSTPTLAASFNRRRFTEPHWYEQGARSDAKTRVHVAIKDDFRQREVEKNLEEWRRSPLSLLFFKHVRHVRVQDVDVHWSSLGPGPVLDSRQMVLGDGDSSGVLLIRSQPEPFPDEALAEIRQERLLGFEEPADFPPCSVEIVLGAKGRLFVVLPTGVATDLPFAINAPFIQDPARLKIKDPETSPTNRWLLGRAGQLAAVSMLAWLNKTDTSNAERAAAYGLLPNAIRKNDSLEGSCGTIVEESFAESVAGENFLLTDDGALVESGHCITLPEPILEVWPPHQAATLFDERGLPALSRHVAEGNRQKLLNTRSIEEIDRRKVLATLKARPLPRPEEWRDLLKLWAYVAPEVTSYWTEFSPKALHIVPIEGTDTLCAAAEVVRLGEKRLLDSDEDWQFLATYLLVLHHAWPRFLADQRRLAGERLDRADIKPVNDAHAVLSKIGLDESTDVSGVIDRVASQFFARERPSIAECVRLAQVAAKLGAKVGPNLCYITRDERLHSLNDHVLFDEDGRLEELVPEAVRESLFLHQEYRGTFRSCTHDEWRAWVANGRSGLLTLPPLMDKHLTVYGRAKVEAEIRKRGARQQPAYPYVTDHFRINDWDFEEGYWRHWEAASQTDGHVWAAITERMATQSGRSWTEARRAEAVQVATTGSTKSIVGEQLLPSWVLHLRELPCLRDHRGFCQKPGDLLRRTPETEYLLDVEAFVDAALDRETTRPFLDLLGVRSTPTGPDRLLDSLRALANSENPPTHEVERWYRRLDQMVNTCSTEDFHRVKDVFRSEKLILTDKGDWATAEAVFLSSNEGDVPGAAIIRESVGHLALWRKLGVAERPTASLAIQWLNSLPLGAKLSPSDLTRVRALLARHPARIWEDCGAWINLAGEWVTIHSLSYVLTMQSLVPWSHLHEGVKQSTADLKDLPVEVTRVTPFSEIPSLATQVEDRLRHDPIVQGDAEDRDWLTTFGVELCRIELDNEDETDRVRTLARRLGSTRWQQAPGLETIPYIGGTPAGTPRRADVVWLRQILYVNQPSIAKLAKRVPEEIAKAFARPEIKSALDYSFERSPEEVRAYLEENFSLSAEAAAPSAESPEAASTLDPELLPLADAEAAESNASVASTSADSAGSEEGVAPPESSGEPAGEAYASGMADDGSTAAARPRPVRNAGIPDIMERFATVHGYRKGGESRYVHPDGSWIAKTTTDRFPWERRSASGNIVCYYLPKNHCLDIAPLVLEADVWGLIDTRPDVYTLVLTDSHGDPIEVPGGRLLELRNQQRLKLYPAAYRLVMEGEDRA